MYSPSQIQLHVTLRCLSLPHLMQLIYTYLMLLFSFFLLFLLQIFVATCNCAGAGVADNVAVVLLLQAQNLQQWDKFKLPKMFVN